MHELLISRGFKPRLGKIIKCLNCGIEVYKQPCHSNRKESFCLQVCHLEYMKKNSFFFLCIICGKKVFTQPTQIKYRHRKTCSIECRGKNLTRLAEERRKKGTMTQHQIDRAERYSKKADEWRRAIFSRDDFTCQMCKTRGSYLEADHIKPWAYFPKLRYELSNGRTLCRPCHDKTKISCKRMRELYA